MRLILKIKRKKQLNILAADIETMEFQNNHTYMNIYTYIYIS